MIIARIGLLHIGTKTPHPSPPTVTLDQTTQKIIVPGASLGHHPVVIAFGSRRFPQVAVNDCRDTCRDLSFLGALTTAPRSPPRFRTVRFFSLRVGGGWRWREKRRNQVSSLRGNLVSIFWQCVSSAPRDYEIAKTDIVGFPLHDSPGGRTEINDELAGNGDPISLIGSDPPNG